jgi:hypothetical protein
MLPSVESSQPGTKHRKIFLGRGHHPRVSWVDLITPFERSVAKNPIHEFVREVPLSGAVGTHPLVEHDLLDPPHCLHFRNAGIRNAVQVTREQRSFVLRRQIAIVRHALVVIVRDEIEDVFLEIRTGARNRLHLVLPDHFSERDAQLSGAHRAGNRHEHFSAAFEVRCIRVGGVDKRCGVEVSELVPDKLRYGAVGFASRGYARLPRRFDCSGMCVSHDVDVNRPRAAVNDLRE